MISTYNILTKPHNVFKPVFEPGKVNQIEQYYMRCSTTWDDEASKALDLKTFFTVNDSINVDRLFSGKEVKHWSLQILDIPNAGKNPVLAQNFYESTIVHHHSKEVLKSQGKVKTEAGTGSPGVEEEQMKAEAVKVKPEVEQMNTGMGHVKTEVEEVIPDIEEVLPDVEEILSDEKEVLPVVKRENSANAEIKTENIGDDFEMPGNPIRDSSGKDPEDGHGLEASHPIEIEGDLPNSSKHKDVLLELQKIADDDAMQIDAPKVSTGGERHSAAKSKDSFLQFIEDLGYEVLNQYWLKGVRFFHGDVVIEIFKIFVTDDAAEAQETKIKLQVLDLSNTFQIKAYISYPKNSSVDAISKGTKTLTDLKAKLHNLFELEVPDRMSMDSRVPRY